MRITRESLINNAHACEVQRLAIELPNDMEFGKAVRTLTNRVTDQITRLQTEALRTNVKNK